MNIPKFRQSTGKRKSHSIHFIDKSLLSQLNSVKNKNNKLFINENQDFLPAPADYFLLGFNVSTSLSFEHSTLKISLNGENILNKRYRDYLNRLRYFSDDAGMNISLRIGWIF